MFPEIKWMDRALKEAQKAFKKEYVPIGAVIIQNNELIAAAHNQEFWHAEILCIQKAQKKLGKYLNDTKIFVTVEPCQMCIHAIKLARIPILIYGAPNNNEPLPKIEIISDINANDAIKLMQQFFIKQRIKK